MVLETTKSIRNGGVLALKSLRESRRIHPWNDNTTKEAALCGDLECLMYAHTHGCPWKESTCIAAAKCGQLACLKYAIEHGCSYGYMTLAASLEHDECFEWLLQCPLKSPNITPFVWNASIYQGNLPRLIDYCHKNHLSKRWDGSVIAHVLIREGVSPLLNLCVDNSAPIDTITYITIAKLGKVPHMEFLMGKTTLTLSEQQKFDIVRTASRRDDTCMLRYLYQRKRFPLNRFAYYHGKDWKTGSNLCCLKFLILNGARLDFRFISDIFLHRDTEAFRWALEVDALTHSTFDNDPFTLFQNRHVSTKVKIYMAIPSRYSHIRYQLALVTPCDFRCEFWEMLDVLNEFYPVKDLTRHDWNDIESVWEGDFRRQLIKRYVYPRGLNVLRWMLKVRPYAWHWFEEVQKGLCRETGNGRKRDRDAFESEFSLSLL